MTDSSRKHRNRIRTFAGDLESERKKRGQETPTAPEPNPTPPSKTPPPAPEPEKRIPQVKKEVPPEPVERPVKKPTIQEPHFTVTAEDSNPVTKIPAFHELHKQTKPIQKSTLDTKPKTHFKQTKKNQKHQKKGEHIRANIGYDATVITDTKRSQFKLLPSIAASIRAWFKQIISKRKKKKEPKYTIPETQRRKGVIQKATSKSGTIFTADSESLKEHIRKRRLQEAHHSREGDVDTSWSPYTEPGFSLLEAPEEQAPAVQNVAVEYTKPHTPETQSPPVQTPEATASLPEETEDTLDELRWKSEDTEPIFTKPTPSITPEPTSEGNLPELDSSEQAQETDTDNPESYEPPQREQSIPARSTHTVERFDTNTLTVVLLLSIIGFVAIISVVVLVVRHTQLGEETPVISTHVDSILRNAEVTPIVLTSEKLADLPNLIQASVETAPSGLVELPLTSPNGDEVTASYIFKLLDYHTLPTLRQSLTAARFASIDQSEPALLLQFVDRNTVLGGLLAWEATMPEDLRSLYTIPTDITGTFSDETIQGVDVRVLRHEGTTVLLYGIIGDNTALMTTNVSDFTQILERGMFQ